MRKIITDFNNKKPEKKFRQFTPKPFLIVIEGGKSELKRAASALERKKQLDKKIFNHIIQK